MASFPRSFTYFLNAPECGFRAGLEKMMERWWFGAPCSKGLLHLTIAMWASGILVSPKNIMKFHQWKERWSPSSHRICSAGWIAVRFLFLSAWPICEAELCLLKEKEFSNVSLRLMASMTNLSEIHFDAGTKHSNMHFWLIRIWPIGKTREEYQGVMGPWEVDDILSQLVWHTAYKTKTPGWWGGNNRLVNNFLNYFKLSIHMFMY